MINIAELLKYAPKDLELYSPICGHCKLSCILYDDGIRVIAHDVPFRFDKYGRFCSADDAECLLFPSKACRTWGGWKLPVEPKFKVGDWLVYKNGDTFAGGFKEVQVKTVEEINRYTFTHNTNGSCNFIDRNCRLWTIADAKDGDVLATDNGWTCIFKAFDECAFSSYCFMDSQKWFCEFGSEAHTLDSRINGNIHPATKEQRGQLFAKIKEAGYQWDADKKKLRKIKSHYDINNFKPFNKVLVRYYSDENWKCGLFSHLSTYSGAKFVCVSATYVQCIPYNDDTKHLLGTTYMCDERYINW